MQEMQPNLSFPPFHNKLSLMLNQSTMKKKKKDGGILHPAQKKKSNLCIKSLNFYVQLFSS